MYGVIPMRAREAPACAAASEPGGLRQISTYALPPHYSPILASLFRQPSPRSPVPPSAFPSGLQPVGSNDRDLHGKLNRRVSRTDLDFEQALLGEGTFSWKEGPDVDTLGVADTSISSISPFSTPGPTPKTPYTGFLPATPTVVPPTPSPSSRPKASSSHKHSVATPASPSSSNEVFYDAEDSDLQTKRRSMYRSPGTASSPDLATLLRKAKERGANNGQSSRQASAMQETTTDESPNKLRVGSATNRLRPSSSKLQLFTPPAVQLSPAPKGRNGAPSTSQSAQDGLNIQASPDWVLASPRSMTSMRDKDSGKAPRSMREKTTAFLGKMLGQGSTRERARTVTSSSSSQSNPSTPSNVASFFDAFNHPVPPLPKEHLYPSTSDLADSGNDAPKPRVPSKAGPAESRKPHARSSSPTKPMVDVPSRTIGKSSNRSKRRSMSVSDADLKKAMSSAGVPSSLRHSGETKKDEGSQVWDSQLNGIITDLKGELSQLDFASVLELRDPSSRPAEPPRSRSDGDSYAQRTLRPTARTAASLPTTPEVTYQLGSSEKSTMGVVISSPPSESSSNAVKAVPPESSQTSMPASFSMSPTSSRSNSQSRNVGLKYGPRAPLSARNRVHMQSPSKDSSRLRVQHRSTASSSEPSLVPARDDGRTLSVLSVFSQQDLTTNDLARGRFSRSRSPGKEDSVDIEMRGKDLATRCWLEDEDFLAKDKIAEWLGGQGLINKVALRHYIDFFDFSGLRLDNAFRHLCAKLYLKAETQQVDRILEEFGRRYWDCNPTSILGSASVVHATAYSLLLLNTDLHVAELSTRMSRSQFVRNTIAAIQSQLQPSNAFSPADTSYDDWSSVRAGSVEGSDNGTQTVRSRTKRSNSTASWNSITREAVMSPMGTPIVTSSTSQHGSTPDATRQTPVNGSMVSVTLSTAESRSHDSVAPVVHDRNWEIEMENMLKEMYNAIKTQQILQPVNSNARSSTSSLTPHGTVLRSRSLRGPPDRLATLKRGSIRGLQSILGAPLGVSPYSSNSSIDGRASPAPSFATSNDGMHSTMSFLTPTLGFASNLSHTIIREAQEDDANSFNSNQSGSTNISIADEELALLGPPWAKEGMLCRKQYWESTGKRAKSKNWLDVFVVIQKGELSMFVFGEHGAGGSGVVGGGNWLENAEPVGTVQLSHSLAHVLPRPGYNRQRPHCMVLTLSNGGVYFFQAGTEELVTEWVMTCNYWAARQSKEPLAGGVSNMEYGWNRVLEPLSRVQSASEDNYSTHEKDSDGASIHSIRSKFSRTNMAATMRAEKSPYVDRTIINDWKPPMPPTVPSTHDEEGQLEALRKHVFSLKKELKRHNELRAPMSNMYPPKSPNGVKALNNWERRSQYLLTEIVKYESYIDSLQGAMSLRLRKRGEKALERALVVTSPDEQPGVTKGRWKRGPGQETIEEDEEPPPTAGLEPVSERLHAHRRERGETDDTE